MHTSNPGVWSFRTNRDIPVLFFNLFIGLVSFLPFSMPTSAQDSLKIVKESGQIECFSVRVAKTPLERQKGLMHEKHLPLNAGMLFDFEQEKSVSMWMKNTLVPLDILFFDSKGILFQIHRDAKPFSERAIRAKKPTKYVLEINAGISRKLGITIGNKLKLTSCTRHSFAFSN